MTQAERLTDEQIEGAYVYFEHGGPSPTNVVIKGSFTRTMGRVWDSELSDFVIL